MNKIFKSIAALLLVALFASCSEERNIDELVVKQEVSDHEGSVDSVGSGPPPPSNPPGSGSDPYKD